ncbi:unnamed protein product [Caenorhabditis angaria]|uniref:SWI/SNF-related matrix-associated actin-dependent regulator of chromatin subfamily A containing DEAD/H box 1 homolog n=1 Tax=Caenorhabditis angaria TaxID=860376 RepID=A0A9P1N130_9PELO|nr:unnamed protein product [Caenorhabditis angaria]
MSSSKFGLGGEKVRVAHRANAQTTNVQADMDVKKALLSKMITSTLNGTKSSAKSGGKKMGAKRARKNESDESEDDFIDDEGVSDDEDDDFEREDLEEEKQRRKVAVKKKASASATDEQSPPEVPKRKQRTLSDSSEDEVDTWHSKPKFENSSSKMKTKAFQKKVTPKKKKIVIEESSDEEEEEKNSNLKLAPKDEAESEEDTVPKKKSKKKVESDEDYYNEEEELGDNSDEERDAEGSETPDSDSDAEERKRKRGETASQKKAREYFNRAEKEDLLMQKGVNEKIAEFILKNRPWKEYQEMMTSLKGVTRGINAVDGYLEHLEKQGILKRILDDCKDHANTVARDFERCTEGPLNLKLISEGFTLHEYQKIGVKWLIMMHQKELNSILGDEMGLGKTIQIVAFLSYLKQSGKSGPHLIVVPSSTIENWVGEFQKWCPSIKLLTYYGNQDERKHLRHRVKKQKDNIDVILTTYNMVTSKTDDKKFFKNFSLNYVIYDEGHMLKNCDSERYRGLMKVKGKRKILLTGTPLQNNLIELISLMYFVLSKVFNKYCEDITHLLQHFKQVGPSLESKDRALYQQDRIDEAKAILQPYILRRLKNQVLGSLPTKTERIVEVEMKEKQQEIYEEILEALRNSDDSGESYGSLMRLRQAANHPLLRRSHYDEDVLDKIAKTLCKREKTYESKNWHHISEDLSYLSDIKIHQLCEKFPCIAKYQLDEKFALESGKIDKLDEMLPEIQKLGDKVLIFSQFTSMLDILEVYLGIRGYSYKRLDGQTPVMERQEMINEFNVTPNRELFVFLLSTKAGGLGINLTSANHIIIHDIDFNPYNDKQAEDRCHRMGQLKNVHVTRLVSKRTVELGMLELAKKKLKLEKQVTDGVKGQLDENEVIKEEDDEIDGEKKKVDKNEVSNLLAHFLMGKIEDICDRYLARREEQVKVTEAVERCLKKGYDYEKLKTRVQDAVSDSHLASKVINAVVDYYPQLRKRQFRDNDEEKDRKRTRDRSRDRDRSSKKSKPDPEKSPQKSGTVAVTEDALRAKELIYRAQQEIEEKKRKMAAGVANLTHASKAMTPATAAGGKAVALGREEAQMFMSVSMDKKSRMEMLKAKLAAKTPRLGEILPPPAMPATPQAEFAVEKKEVLEKEPAAGKEKILEYLDPRIDLKSAERRRRGFAFHEKGEFEKLANKQRALAKLERLQNEVSSAAKSTGISSAVKLAMVTPSGTAGKADNSIVPDIEWWDTLVLDKLNYDEIPEASDADRYSQTISELVEHPISLRPPTDPLVPQYLKVYLTTKERKKIRRQNRKEVLKERTEKIRLGLEKAPEAKVKIGNLMRVLGNEAIQDPTKMEAHVRKQMAERLKKHETLNAERKLTDDQKKAKKTKKLAEDTSTAVNVAVYRVKSLTHPSKKFKVETNAKQLQMSGAIMMHKAQNIVVVEGGPKQQKFYKNLMLNRIKWSDEIIGQKKEAEKDAPGERNLCEMIWEGQVKRRNFKDFQVHTAQLEKQAREFFEKHGVAQYWDLCYSTTVLLEGQDVLPTA